MKIKALIPVRSGSQRVPNKNIRPFAGSSLLEIKIKQLLRVKGLDGVVVNSNSDEMLDIAARCGAETVKRDEYFATNSIPINAVYEHLAQHIEADVIICSHCTSPLVRTTTYKKCMDIFFEHQTKYDSVVTTSILKEYLWRNEKPVNYQLIAKPRSQDLPDDFMILNSAIHILSREKMIVNKDIIGDTPFFYPISRLESVDIDDEIDFEFAEFLYKKFVLGNENEY